jgi:hypothetical protein
MIIVDPAKMEDLAELSPVLQERVFRGLVVQMSRSVAVTLRDQESDKLLAITGIYPMGDHGEAWVYFGKGVRHSRHIVPVIRKLVQLVKGMRRIAVMVKMDNDEGRRFAHLAGFRRDKVMFGGDYLYYMLNP